MIRMYVVVIVLFSTLLAACTPVRMPPVSQYTLTSLKPVITSHRAKTHYTLLVSVPIAAPGYQSTDMIYVYQPYQLRAYANNQWVAPPAQMLLPLIAQGIRNKNYFKAVVTPPFSGVTDYRVSSHLIELQQEFIQPISQVRLIMQVDLMSNRSNRVIASRIFQVVVNAPENNPYSGVIAANTAVRIMVNKITSMVITNI